MANMIVLISKKAKKIRRPGEGWQSALGRARKQVMGKASLSPSKKSAKRKTAKKKTSKKKDPNRQTEKGRSNLLYDRMVKAKTPGKRKVKSGKSSHVYYERRQNRSDAPGKMTGTAYSFNILSRMRTNTIMVNQAEETIKRLTASKKGKKGPELNQVKKEIVRLKKYVSTLKSDNRMLKRLI